MSRIPPTPAAAALAPTATSPFHQPPSSSVRDPPPASKDSLDPSYRTPQASPRSYHSSSPDLDRVDFSFSPSPASTSPRCRCEDEAKQLDFKAALLSKQPVLQPHQCAPQQPAGHPSLPRLRSVLVLPEPGKASSSFSSRTARPAAPGKVWRPVLKTAQDGLSDHGNRGWEEVRRKRRTEKETGQRRPVHARLGPAPKHRPSVHLRLGPSIPELFKKQATGRCFKCLASDHLVAHCRDPPRCLLCLRSGHRARHYKNPPSASTAKRTAPPPPPPPPSSTVAFPQLPTMPPHRSFSVGHHTRRP